MSAWFALGCWLTLSGLTGAPSAPEALANRLALRIAAPPTVAAALTARLSPRLAALGVALDVASVPAVDVERVLELPADNRPDAPLARGWLNGQDIDSAVLLLIPRGTDSVLIRTVPLMLGVDEAGLAQLTYIIEQSMGSLLASQPIGVPHAEARAALGTVAAARATAGGTAAAPATALRVGLFAGGGSWSSSALLVARVGLDVDVDRARGAAVIGLAASFAVDPGFHSVDADGDLLVRAAALHVSATAGRRFGRFGVGKVAAGPALLITHIAPTLASASSGAVVAGAARTDLDPAIGLAARWDLPLGRVSGLFLAATVDVVPTRAQYAEVINNTANRVLFSPWPVRPGLVLGVTAGAGRH